MENLNVEQKLETKPKNQIFEILNWILIVALMINVIYKVYNFISWLPQIDFWLIIWTIVVASFCYEIYKKNPFDYAAVSLIFIGFLLEALSNDFIGQFYNNFAINTIMSIDYIIIIILSLFIWGKYFNFKIEFRKINIK
jgi:hypothetical protein